MICFPGVFVVYEDYDVVLGVSGDLFESVGAVYVGDCDAFSLIGVAIVADGFVPDQ